MTRILLLRHGQSTWNAETRWQGQADPPLSDFGRLQAAEAAERIGLVDAIWSSDLQRAHETAEIVAHGIGVGPVNVDAAFRERDAGEWTGLTRDEIESQWPGFLQGLERPPGYETDESVLARLVPALHAVAASHPDGHVLVVSHGGVIRVLERHLDEDRGPVANLSGWWVRHHEEELRPGERVVFLDMDPA